MKKLINYVFEILKSADYIELNEEQIAEIGYPDLSEINSVLSYFSRIGYRINAERYAINGKISNINWIDSDSMENFINGTWNLNGAVEVNWVNHPEDYEPMSNNWALMVEYVDGKLKDVTCTDMEDNTEIYLIDRYKRIKWIETKMVGGKEKRFLHF